MKRTTIGFIVATLLVAAAPRLAADVKTQHKNIFQMGGMLGGIVNRFAGDIAKDGLISTIGVKGNRQIRLNDKTGRIIDLAEEKVYDLDLKKKEYKVTTFAELRKQWQDAQAKAKSDVSSGGSDQPADPKQQGKQMEVTFSVKETGQKKTIGGKDTHETVVVITMKEKGKALDESGGLEITTSFWLTAKIAALEEVGAFDAKFAKAIYGDMLTGADMNQMSMLLAQYPSMKELTDKLAVEAKKLEGTPMLVAMTMEAVKGPEDGASQSQSGGGGGLMGRIAGRLAKPKGGDARSKVFTSSDEVLSVETTVTAEDTAIPAGFKEKK